MRRVLSISALLQTVTGVMTVTLVIIFSPSLCDACSRRANGGRSDFIPPIVDISNDLFAFAMQAFRVPLRTRCGHLMLSISPRRATTPIARNEIAAQRAKADKALDSAFTKLAVIKLSGSQPIINQINENRNLFAALRRETGAVLRFEAPHSAELSANWIAVDFRLVRAIDALSSRLDNEFNEGDPFIVKMMVLKRLAGSFRVDSGDDRQLVAQALLAGARPLDAQHQQFAEARGRVDGKWAIIKEETRQPATPPQIRAAIEAVDKLYFTELRPKRDAIVEELAAGGPVSTTASAWRPLSTAAQLSVFSVATVALNVAGAYAEAQAAAAKQDFYGASLLMVLFSGVGIFTALYVMKAVVRPIAKIGDTMRLRPQKAIFRFRYRSNSATMRSAFWPARFACSATTPLRNSTCASPRKAPRLPIAQSRIS